MVTATEIGWGSYQGWEGPYWKGKCAYSLPDNPTELDRQLLVISTTEGSHYDAYNGYDRCICTSGLIQWCDRAPSFLVCGVLGKAAESNPDLLIPMHAVLEKYGYTFKLAPGNGYRYFTTSGGLIGTPEAQQRMFFGSCTGAKGQWIPDCMVRAREWSAAISSVWEQLAAQAVQRTYTEARLSWFVMKQAKPLLDSLPNNAIGNCFNAAYLSFAANNPLKANNALQGLVSQQAGPDKDWLIEGLKALTLKPGIAIYPHRYDVIRPVLEKLYGIDLPDFSAELQAWKSANEFNGVLTPKQLQLGLLTLGYDLGPSGADGVAGKLTQAALQKFEGTCSEIPELYRDGMPDKYTVPELEKALAAQGKDLWAL